MMVYTIEVWRRCCGALEDKLGEKKIKTLPTRADISKISEELAGDVSLLAGFESLYYRVIQTRKPHYIKDEGFC